MSIKLIVGLGNPGNQYKDTKHNIGFMAIDQLASHFKVDLEESKFNGIFHKFNHEGQTVILAKPLTFMNLSGQFVRGIVDFFKIETQDILVIFDDVDTEPGNIRIRKRGSSGGQNGIKDIMNNLGTEDVKRVRIGIGRPTSPAPGTISRMAVTPLHEHVLAKIRSEEKPIIKKGLDKAIKVAIAFITEDFEKIMSQNS